MGITNPNGANQYQLDPRQKLCWESYINPKSATFGNAYQSAMRAGYEEGYAAQITTIEWFLEKMRRLNMLAKAEKVLDKTLTLEAVDDKGKADVQLLRVQTDVAKHITSTLGKNEGYATRTEQTGADGGPQKMVIGWSDDTNNASENTLQPSDTTEDDSPINEAVERNSSAS